MLSPYFVEQGMEMLSEDVKLSHRTVDIDKVKNIPKEHSSSVYEDFNAIFLMN